MASNDTERSTGDVGLRLTYAEIAARLGISGDAARQLVRRRGWLRIVPNRRGATTAVIVPEGELAGEQWRDMRPPNDGGTTPDGNRYELRTALTLVDRLSVQLGEANARVGQAIERADKAEVRADRAEAVIADERQRADALRTQIDVLNAEMMTYRAEADRAMADERMRADRVSAQLEALSAEVVRAEKQAEGAVGRADQAEQGREAERTRADALRDHLTAMREQLADAHAALQAAEAADARAERAEADRAEERGRADRAETATAAERDRADALRERIEALQSQLTARQEVIDAAETTRRAPRMNGGRGAYWRGSGPRGGEIDLDHDRAVNP